MPAEGAVPVAGGEGPPRRRAERRPLDLVSLLAGLLYLAVGALFLLDRGDVLDVDPQWAWPALLIGLGCLGLVISGSRARATRRREPPSADPS